MIEKCQCPKPDFIDGYSTTLQPSWTYDYICQVIPPDALHFRKATMHCDRCGAGICERCGFHRWGDVNGIPDYKPYFTDILKVYCRTCAEQEEQC